MQFRGVFWFPMVLNDPCGPRYVTDTLGKGPGSLWEASGMPPQPPGEQAGGVRLGSFSALVIISSQRASEHSALISAWPDYDSSLQSLQSKVLRKASNQSVMKHFSCQLCPIVHSAADCICWPLNTIYAWMNRIKNGGQTSSHRQKLDIF